MGRVLIVGAGGVGGVVAQKCAQFPEVFSEIVLASRTLDKCERIRRQLSRPIQIDQVDAGSSREMTALIRKHAPDVVIQVALPYQNLAIMDACVETGVSYLDTACYEPPDQARYSHTWQWKYDEPFRKQGLMAVLGCGFDPGVTNLYIAHALKNHFDEIHSVDILDCNAGQHGFAFATNFNPEINIREVTAVGRYYENGQWVETAPLSVRQTYDFPEVGPRDVYLMYHEELESLVKHIHGLKRIRFWMTFSQEYLTHLRVLQNVGMTRIDKVLHQGVEIVPLQFLKTLLPEPSALGETYSGKTCIGCLIEGVKDGRIRKVLIYNVCDHAASYREVKATAVSYTAGVPPVLGAELMLRGIWSGAGVFNVEQLDPAPFMERVGRYGLPWKERFLDDDAPTGWKA
ncbi:MAG: saccharopine dehydrogenase family protein [Deltaproteobacteria bacterium]|nr:saccharopine dehydrogenase family protein [Deltaproteobacteria bacterium]